MRYNRDVASNNSGRLSITIPGLGWPLTLLFVILKACEVSPFVGWSWLTCFLPLMIGTSLGLLVGAFVFLHFVRRL